MDIADDIAYSCYDLEDCLKAGFLSMQDFFSVNDEIAEKIRGRLKIPVCNTIEEVKDTLKQVFSKHIFKPSVSLMKDIIDAVTSSDNEERATILSLSASTKYIDNISKLFKMMSCQGYERTEFTASLVDDFISNIELIPNEQYPALSKVRLKDETAKKVEVLKQFNYVKIITSPMLKIVEHRGKDIINKLFISLKENPCLLPNDFKILFDSFKNEAEKNRVVCDFIAGMTDRFAVEYYSRLFSESAESIFKPV
jgi:dGTPase